MPTSRTLYACNQGDGSLSLSALVQSGVNWLTVSVGTQSNRCPFATPVPAVALLFTIDVSHLAWGTHTAAVTISDPHSIDAPQVVTVTALVDGGDPVAIDAYLAPGTEKVVPITTGTPSDRCPPGCPEVTANVPDGGTWLSISYVSSGTFNYSEVEYVHLAPPAGMAPGAYSGSVSVNTYAIRTIPVTMRVTTQPIAVPSVSQIDLRLTQDGPATTDPFLPAISLTNSGTGVLQVQGVSAAGEGVSAYQVGGLAIVMVDPGSRGPGIYTEGMVTIHCNGANCPLKIPVNLEIEPQAAPTINYLGIVDNAIQLQGAVVAGDVCLVLGDQLSSVGPDWAAGLPLPPVWAERWCW